MYCQNCGKEIEGNFCGYCGTKNVLIESKSNVVGGNLYREYETKNEGDFSEQYASGNVAVTINSEKKSNMPYVYFVVINILRIALTYVVALIVDEVYDYDISYLEQMQYLSLNEVLHAVSTLILLGIGIGIIRNFKLFLITLGCETVASAVIGFFVGVVQYIVSLTVGDIDILFYGTYNTYENIVVIILRIVVSCVAYYLVQQMFVEKKAEPARESQPGMPSTSLYTPYATDKSTRSRTAAALLCFFLGFLGIHRLYVGKVGTGLLWMFTGGLFGIGSFIDFFIIIFGGFKDADGKTV